MKTPFDITAIRQAEAAALLAENPTADRDPKAFSHKVADRTMKVVERDHPETYRRIEEAASMAQFTTRRYGTGAFYTWATVPVEGGKLDLGDPSPSARWHRGELLVATGQAIKNHEITRQLIKDIEREGQLPAGAENLNLLAEQIYRIERGGPPDVSSASYESWREERFKRALEESQGIYRPENLADVLTRAGYAALAVPKETLGAVPARELEYALVEKAQAFIAEHEAPHTPLRDPYEETRVALVYGAMKQHLHELREEGHAFLIMTPEELKGVAPKALIEELREDTPVVLTLLGGKGPLPPVKEGDDIYVDLRNHDISDYVYTNFSEGPEFTHCLLKPGERERLIELVKPLYPTLLAVRDKGISCITITPAKEAAPKVSALMEGDREDRYTVQHEDMEGAGWRCRGIILSTQHDGTVNYDIEYSRAHRHLPAEIIGAAMAPIQGHELDQERARREEEHARAVEDELRRMAEANGITVAPGSNLATLVDAIIAERMADGAMNEYERVRACRALFTQVERTIEADSYRETAPSTGRATGHER